MPKISKGKNSKHPLWLALRESYSLAKQRTWRIVTTVVMVLYLSDTGTNNARLGGMLRQLAMYYHKDANNLFMVRLAQVRFSRRKIIYSVKVDIFVSVRYEIYNNACRQCLTVTADSIAVKKAQIM